MGPGSHTGTDLGPLINASARDSMSEIVEAAMSNGATLRSGGSSPREVGSYWEPTVLDHVAPDSPILGTEVFGPVAPIVSFSSDDEAIDMANATEHGLAAYVFSGDLRRALRAAESIETGMVGINRGVISDPAAPFGGVKESGIGREGGHEGIAAFIEDKYVAVDWS